MAVVNTYFKKGEEHRVMYKSEGTCIRVDYMLCRRVSQKEIEDSNVVTGESVVRQHRMVALEIKQRRRLRAEFKVNWWKLKKENRKVELRTF